MVKWEIIRFYLIKVEKLAHSQNIWLDNLLDHLLLNINILNIVRTDRACPRVRLKVVPVLRRIFMF